MAKLPDEFALGTNPTPTPFGRGESIARVDIDNAALAQAKVGNVLVDIGDRLQKEYDVTNANDVYNNGFSSEFRDLYQKYYTLQGKNAVEQMPVFLKQMQEVKDKYRNNLDNETQKKLFDGMTRHRVEYEMDGITRFADQQGKIWQKTTKDASVKNYVNMASSTSFDDMGEKKFTQAIEGIHLVIDDYTRAAGLAPEVRNAEVRHWTSVAASGRVQRWALQSDADAVKAAAWYKSNQPLFDADQRYQIEHNLKPLVKKAELNFEWQGYLTRNADQIKSTDRDISNAEPKELADTQRFLQNASTPEGAYARALAVQQAQELKPAVNAATVAAAIFGQESSGGKANTSFVNPQGVTGPMQIKNTTWEQYQNQGVIPKNLKWDNPADNKKGGDLLVEHYFNKYGGDVAKVAAAYYGGEGAVNTDGTINRGWKNLQRPSDPTVGQYVDQVVARTGAVASSSVQATQARKAAPQVPGAEMRTPDIRVQYANMYDDIQRTYAGDPEKMQFMVSKLDNMFAHKVRVQDAVQNGAFNKLLEGMRGTDGKPPALDLNTLIDSDPVMKEAWQQLPGTQRSSLMDLSSRILRGDNSQEKQASKALYNTMYSAIVRGEITNIGQINSRVNDLGVEHHKELYKVFNTMQSESGRGPLVDTDRAIRNLTGMILGAPSATMRAESYASEVMKQPLQYRIAGTIAQAHHDLRTEIQTREKNGKPTDTLFKPGNPDYFLSQENVAKYTIQAESELRGGVREAAAQITAQQKLAAVPYTDDKAFDSAKPGTVFVRTMPDGSKMYKVSGSAAQAAPANATSPSKSTQKASGKIRIAEDAGK